MLSKSIQVYFSSKLRTRTLLLTCGQEFRDYVSGISISSHNSFCTATEPRKADDSVPLATVESPELPSWVKVSSNDARADKKTDDEDFVPPSLSYWIENQKLHDPEHDKKSTIEEDESDVDRLSKILKNPFESTDSVINALSGCDVDVSDSLVEQVLRRFSCEWIPSYGFFKWVESHTGKKHSPDLYNLMVDNLGKTKRFDVMWELVEEMKSLEGYVTLDTMMKVIRRLARACKYDDAVETFKRMETYGVKKDIISVNMFLDTLVKERSVEHAERVFSEYKDEIPPNSQTYNSLVYGWCKSRQIEKAVTVVNEMKRNGIPAETITYTHFIAAYCHDKDFRKVNDTLTEMKNNGLKPSVVTYTIMMTAYAKAKEINNAMEVYETMKRDGISPDTIFYGEFLNTLSRAGRLKDSDTVFEDMFKQGIHADVSTYNKLIYIAAKNSDEERALGLLLKMEEDKCKPDLFTYSPLLKMCCRLKRMKVLSFLLNHMFKNDVSIDVGTYDLLVCRLCKHGGVERACELFEEMVLKGLVPRKCTHDNLVWRLEKKGLHEAKREVEALMSKAEVQRNGRSSSASRNEVKDSA